MKIRSNITSFLKSIGLFLCFLVGVSFVAFCMLEVSPVDPVQAFVRGRGSALSADQEALLAAQWGLDKPFLERYFIWLSHVMVGDLGVSRIYQKPVGEVIWYAFSLSAPLIFIAWILQGILAVYLGITSALHKGKKADTLIVGYCTLMMSTPSFWLGFILILVFSIKLGMFPIGFSAPVGKLMQNISLSDRVIYMVLPLLTLVLTGLSRVCLHTRAKTLEVLQSDYVAYAMSKGVSRSKCIKKYAFKNILFPALMLQCASISDIFSGIVLVETVFNYPGLGEICVKAALSSDMPLLLGIVLFSAIFVYLGNRLGDYVSTQIDKRIEGEV